MGRYNQTHDFTIIGTFLMKLHSKKETKLSNSFHPLKCVQWVVLLGGALGRMFGGSPQFLFVFYRPDRRENVRS